MKTYQTKNNYKPIDVRLETSEEAEAFFSLIDKLDSFISHSNSEIEFKKITKAEKQVINFLSDAVTNKDVRF